MTLFARDLLPLFDSSDLSYDEYMIFNIKNFTVTLLSGFILVTLASNLNMLIISKARQYQLPIRQVASEKVNEAILEKLTQDLVSGVCDEKFDGLLQGHGEGSERYESVKNYFQQILTADQDMVFARELLSRIRSKNIEGAQLTLLTDEREFELCGRNYPESDVRYYQYESLSTSVKILIGSSGLGYHCCKIK